MPIGTWGKINRTEIQPGRWRAETRYRDVDGATRRVRRFTPDGVKDAKGVRAERALIEALTTRQRAATGDIAAGSTRVVDLWKLYREQLVAADRADRTLTRYDEIAVFIANGTGKSMGIGGLRLPEATTQRIERFLGDVAADRGKGNAIAARSVLSGMFKMAARLGVVDSNPVRDTSPVAVPRAPKKSLSVDELAALLEAIRSSDVPCPELDGGGNPKRSRYRIPTVAQYCARADLEAVIVMFVATGVRMSELLGMQWSGLDLKKRTIRIDGKVTWVKGVGMQRVSGIDDPKNTHRILELPDFAVAMLRERKLAAAPNDWDVILPSTAGTLRDPAAVNKQWRRVRAALGLEWVQGHTFRRSVASLLDDEKVSARATADQLGHKNPSMTMDKYMARGKVRSDLARVLDARITGH